MSQSLLDQGLNSDMQGNYKPTWKQLKIQSQSLLDQGLNSDLNQILNSASPVAQLGVTIPFRSGT